MSYEVRVMSQEFPVLNFEFRNSNLFSICNLEFGAYTDRRKVA